MRIIQYLKSSKVAVVLIALLLIVQAFADLSLPRYTSDLVDVGIQQGGIEHASPDEMSADTFNYVCMLADENDEQLIRDSYKQDGGSEGANNESAEGRVVLTDQGKQQREVLDAAIALPIVLVHAQDILGDFGQENQDDSAQAAQNGTTQTSQDTSAQATQDASEPSAQMGQLSSFDLAQMYAAYESGALSKSEILSLIDQARALFGNIDDSLIEQQAIEAVKAECKALGMDLGAIQLQYLAWLGAQMLAVAALMMAASISVGFVASRTAAKIARNLRERLFEKVVSFSDAEVQSFSAASLITRGTNDIQQIQMVLVMFLRMVLYAPILAIGGIIMVSQTNLAMSWIIVLAIVIIGIVIALLMALALPKFKIMQKLIDRVNLVSREMLTGMSVIRAFDRQEYEEARFDEASTALYKTQLFTNRVMTFMMPTMMLVMTGVSGLIVWGGGSYIDSGVI
ncbi:MAG: ABC transporter permease, partial [Eggerthellaceae bacterium]|nr:ABC transporter permease [Eggerthellaceae bacterium]